MAPTIRLHAPPSGVHRLHSSLQEVRDAHVATIEREAFAQGFEAGRQEAMDSGVKALDKAIAQLEQRAGEASKELGQISVELGVEIARALVQVQIEAGDYDLERILRSTLADSGIGRGDVVVHVNPEDHATIEAAGFRSGTTFAVDPSLPRGDVHLATPRGLLVRDVEDILSTVREQLLEDLA